MLALLALMLDKFPVELFLRYGDIFGVISALAYVACFFIVLIVQFQKASRRSAAWGLVTGGIWTFIWGWWNAGKLKIKLIMLIWTLSVIGIIIYGLLDDFVHGRNPFQNM